MKPPLLLLLLLLLTPACLAQTTTLAPNMVPVCGSCVITAVTDMAGKPLVPTFQAGDGVVWGQLFTPTLPLTVNYTNQTNLGWPAFVSGHVPTEIDAQQSAIAYTVTWTNGLTSQTVTIPAAMTSSVTAAVTAAPPTVSTSAPVIPAQTTLCTVPRNGGPCKTTTPITLPPLTVPSGGTYKFTCTVAGGITVDAFGNLVVPPLSCTAVKQ